MRRTISDRNPFYETPRFAFGYELLPEHGRLLDFGCHDGTFGKLLKQHRNLEYIGVDKNRDAVRAASPGIVIMDLVYPLPFPDGHFDVVTIFEVIEHLADPAMVLDEIFRIVKPGGLLLLSVPRRHIFSFLDLANFKFVFPGLHRFYYSLTRSPDAYRRRYSNNPHGLIGDIEKEKSWHQHFTEPEIRGLVQRSGFKVEEIDGAGLFSQVFTFLAYVCRLRFFFPPRVRLWDSYKFHYSSLFCAARRGK